MSIKKAVILAVGPESQMLPVSSVIPTALLPVCGKPIIQHIVEEASDSGITEIVLVLSKGHELIADYFRPKDLTEQQLAESEDNEAFRRLKEIWKKVKITVIHQSGSGLGNALQCAKPNVGNEPFAVLLSQSIVKTDNCSPFTGTLINAFEKYGRTVFGVQRGTRDIRPKYGMMQGVEVDKGIFRTDHNSAPYISDSPRSEMALCARYVFTSAIFSCIEECTDGKDNLADLTSAMLKLPPDASPVGVLMEGDRLDISDAKGFLLANLSLTEFGCQ